MASRAPSAPAVPPADSHVYKGLVRGALHSVLQLHQSGLLRGAYGSTERIQMIEALADIFNDKTKWTGLGPADTCNTKILLEEKHIAGWVHGALNAWSADTTTDPQRSSIRACARTLRCWGRLEKKLPVVEAAELTTIEKMDDEDVTMDP